MSPPVERWSAAELPARALMTTQGRRRKGEIELEKCELFEMLQYTCVVEGQTDAERHSRGARVVCRPVERWFRRCQDRKGGFMVETTAWEGTR